MTIFYLIRHGETEWNVTGRWQGHMDIPLNDVGLAQAQRVAERLREENMHFDVLYSSDLQRAWMTAQTIGTALDIEPQPQQALREIDLGTWGGRTRAEIQESDPETLARIDAGEDLPRGGAERITDLRARVVSAVEQIATQHRGETIGLVAHGGTIRSLLAHATQGTPQALGWGQHIGNTAISVVIRTAAGWDVSVINDMAHLNGTDQAPDLMSTPPGDAEQV
ncbi:MAG: Broad specificity phosphatase PhoE [Chloroflexi bacterium AL-W]|nr:Broad specificity phosphatase PhoE [Chloroflexi bacterium AL-N1]NOK70175.1 Broad specificity phosphatase PhoE [Chloroflexi bacterium AL-N10]NOK77712.1 Broad specificity phosphatase PhoE [Chloroflexi bacterium AL-N5]NOK84721.1 Broad specificity phosphatase PhoE [Chloroflexi bacterium AL-W]NOK93216.1 Broad specificity phosphatase PhoE [Chloroflexi bacterium AL-N15]